MAFRVIAAGGIVLMASTISHARAEAGNQGHLVPVKPIFQPDGPYATTYARLVEEKLFTDPNWVIRYHYVSKAEIGLAVTREQDGRFLLTVKQTKPTLEYIVATAFSLKWDLKSALATLELHEAHAHIPETTVVAIRRYWISLLNDVRPSPPVFRNKALVHSNKVTLFAKTKEGKLLQGELPADASEHSRLSAVEDIVDDLLSVCVKSQSTHKTLFERIERKAQTSRDHDANVR